VLDHSLVCRGKGKPGAGLPAFEDSDRGDCGLVPGTGICLNGCDKHSKHTFTNVIEKSSPLVIISCSSIRAPGCSSIRAPGSGNDERMDNTDVVPIAKVSGGHR